jgi:hypothetical protein
MARQTTEPSAAARHARGSSASAGQARGLRALLQSLNLRVWGGGYPILGLDWNFHGSRKIPKVSTSSC